MFMNLYCEHEHFVDGLQYHITLWSRLDYAMRIINRQYIYSMFSHFYKKFYCLTTLFWIIQTIENTRIVCSTKAHNEHIIVHIWTYYVTHKSLKFRNKRKSLLQKCLFYGKLIDFLCFTNQFIICCC